MVDTAAWHRDLATGTLDTDLDAGSDLDIFMLIGVVDRVMREKRYLEPTARRLRIILQELLSNVARHVPDQQARVHLTLRETDLRGVVIDVGDNGPGIPADVIDRYTERLLAGEREHGLVLVKRLASGLHQKPPASWQLANHVGYDLLEPQPRPSALTKNKRVGLIRIEYTSPKVLWIGPEESYVNYPYSTDSLDRFYMAAQRGWLPLLAPYFDPVHEASHLAIEFFGRDFPTQVGFFWRDVLDAIAVFFPDRITQQRVVLFGQDVDHQLKDDAKDWARERGLPWFDSEAAAAAYLAAQTAG